MAAERPFAAGLVLAAGASRRLGRPKQLLPYGGATLLDHVLATARASPFDQRICALGSGAPEVLRRVDLDGFVVAVNEDFGAGCSSSIAAALQAVSAEATVLVVMLGDQPGVTAHAVEALLAGRGDAALAVCRYDDGRGHPFAFGRAAFGDLAALRGDKAVWKLLDRAGADVVEVPVAGPVPRDVDTRADYEAVLREVAT